MTPAEKIDRVRVLAQSVAARELVDLADELLAALEAVARLRLAQQELDRLNRTKSRESDRIKQRELVARLTDEVDLALALLDVGRQDAAPGAPLEPVAGWR